MLAARYLRVAEQELLEARDFYNDRNPSLGLRFLEDVENVITRLQQNPLLGKTVRPNIRETLLRRFPYRLLYGVEETEIVIVAVAHFKRQPMYWSGRAGT